MLRARLLRESQSARSTDHLSNRSVRLPDPVNVHVAIRLAVEHLVALLTSVTTSSISLLPVLSMPASCTPVVACAALGR